MKYLKYGLFYAISYFIISFGICFIVSNVSPFSGSGFEEMFILIVVFVFYFGVSVGMILDKIEGNKR